MTITIPQNIVRCLSIVKEKTGMDEAMIAIDLVRQGLIGYANNIKSQSENHHDLEFKKEAKEVSEEILTEIHSEDKKIYH
jgi:hypothetical protein